MGGSVLEPLRSHAVMISAPPASACRLASSRPGPGLVQSEMPTGALHSFQSPFLEASMPRTKHERVSPGRSKVPSTQSARVRAARLPNLLWCAVAQTDPQQPIILGWWISNAHGLYQASWRLRKRLQISVLPHSFEVRSPSVTIALICQNDSVARGAGPGREALLHGPGRDRHVRILLQGGRQCEQDTDVAQKSGRLQPSIAVFPQGCMGQLAFVGPT